MEIKDKELHRIVTTTLVYKSDFTYLITKRAMHKKVKPGKWTIPGGGLSTDDYINSAPTTVADISWYHVLETVNRREIHEETNLEIGKPEFFCDMTIVQPNGTPVLILSYFAPYISGEVVLDVDATEYAWVTAEQAKQYDLITGVWDEINDIDLILKSRK